MVIGVSRNAYKREVSVSLGADNAVAHGNQAKNAVLEAADGVGADIVIECVGHLPLLGEAIGLARPRGKIVPFGVYPSRQEDLPFYDFYFKELQILNVRAAKGRDFSKCIELVNHGKVDLGVLITHILPFTDLKNAIRMLMEPGDERLKIILERV